MGGETGRERKKGREGGKDRRKGKGKPHKFSKVGAYAGYVVCMHCINKLHPVSQSYINHRSKTAKMKIL